MKIIPIVYICLVCMSGCSLRPEAKAPITRYALAPDIKLTCTPLSSTKLIRLHFAEGTASLLHENILYTKVDLKAGNYLYSKWNEPPENSILTSLYTALKQTGVFRDVIYTDTSIRSDITLESRILTFEHRFTDEEHSYGLLILDALIYDSNTHEVLASRLFTSKVNAQSNDAQGGVEALNLALGNILSELICWSGSYADADLSKTVD